MSKTGYSWYELSKALNDALLPQMEPKGFLSQDTPEDDPTHQIQGGLGDPPHYRRFVRPSPLGYDTMECRFTSITYAKTESKRVEVDVMLGVHVTAVEQLELEIGASVNPRRIGRREADIWHLERNLAQLKHLDEASVTAGVVMETLASTGEAFWAGHRTLDEVLHYFATWSVEDRHSPRGAAHVSRYLLLIACLKGDRRLFEDTVREYQPFIIPHIYGKSFNFLAQTLLRKFDGAGSQNEPVQQ